MLNWRRLGRAMFSVAETVRFRFILRDGSKREVVTKVGRHILEVAKQNDVELQGACEASLACSTCHVILPQKLFHQLPSPKDQEQDLLDLAFGLTGTSRLGCQVIITPNFQNAEIVLPKASRNLYVDGSKPASH